MSTRSIIAVPEGDAWKGRYHHWDGYPTGLGYDLWVQFHVSFDQNVEKMRRVLTSEHTSWSTIVQADWSKTPGARDRNEEPCAVCGQEAWRHYQQEYKARGLPVPERRAPNNYNVLGHDLKHSRAPECHCHRHDGQPTAEREDYWITPFGDDSGTEWCYVLGEDGLFVFERVHADGTPAMGMFGLSAAPDGRWSYQGMVPWLSSPEAARQQMQHIGRE